MPLFVRTPRNEAVLRDVGPYPGYLNLLDRKQTAVQRAIRRSGLGGYEPATQATLLSLVEVAKRPVEFFDVGAHIGLYSGLIASVFPRDLVHVTAFEPTPSTAAITRDLIRKNHLPVRLEELALAAEKGTATLYISDKAETSNSLTEGFRDSSQSVTVPMTTLDDYCVEHDTQPTVMKIDVETYESYVLQGALTTIKDARPSIVCELLPAAAPKPTEQVLEALKSLGYHVHFWDDDGWTECEITTVLQHTSHQLRDWLFTPDVLTARFTSALQAWLTAIAELTAEENILTSPGELPPPGWGAPHRPTFEVTP